MIGKFEIEEIVIVTNINTLRADRGGRDAARFNDEDKAFWEPVGSTGSMSFHLPQQRHQDRAARSERDAFGEISSISHHLR